MAQKCKDKVCTACEQIYHPTTRNQKRCETCKIDKYFGKAPSCKCGCGELVQWSHPRKNWALFKPGHHLKALTSGISYNIEEGNLSNQQTKWGIKQFTCEWCNKSYENRYENSKFCSKKCLHAWLRDGNANKGRTYQNTTGKTWKKYKNMYHPVTGVLLREHIYLMEQIIGRRLTHTEVVHHIDNDGLNNEKSNLFLFHCDLCHRYHHITGEPLNYRYVKMHEIGWSPPTYKRNWRKTDFKPKKVIRYSIKCNNCGEVFETKREKAKYCSQNCYHTKTTGPEHPRWKTGKHSIYNKD